MLGNGSHSEGHITCALIRRTVCQWLPVKAVSPQGSFGVGEGERVGGVCCVAELAVI